MVAWTGSDWKLDCSWFAVGLYSVVTCDWQVKVSSGMTPSGLEPMSR